jgi:hypothetical protein
MPTKHAKYTKKTKTIYGQIMLYHCKRWFFCVFRVFSGPKTLRILCVSASLRALFCLDATL